MANGKEEAEADSIAQRKDGKVVPSSILESAFVTKEPDEVLRMLDTSLAGLSERKVKERRALYGLNELAKKRKRGLLFQFFSKFANPLVAVLLVIAGVSFFFGITGKDAEEIISGFFVLLMAFLSVILSFVQEYRAGKEAEKLAEMIRATASIIRNGRPVEVKISELVPGDIVDLYAGDMIPADLRIVSCKDLFVNQSSLTGESFPVEKTASDVSPKGSIVTELSNIAFMGSSVVSGTALGVVVKTGTRTQFGEISRRLAQARMETDFEKGTRNFTWLMIKFMFILVLLIFSVNALMKHDILQALLFSLAVAVGLTPEMLPMIVAINLSKGAISMSKKQVIVKRLNAIQNLGAMDVLCTDKTGTLTENVIVLEKHLDVEGKQSEDVLRYAYLNSTYQTGLKNLLDKAILAHEKFGVKRYKKIDEIPFDFSRKVMSVVVEIEASPVLITKGAPEEIFSRSSHYELDGKIHPIDPRIIDELKKAYTNLSIEGFRVLAISYRKMEKKETYTKEDERDMVLKGYLAFLDPPKATAKAAVKTLSLYGIALKVVTGDNELVTKHICETVGIPITGLVNGDELDRISEEELRKIVETSNVFVRMSPIQKERIVRACHDNGHVVGYMGDGINDAPALKASDVGISVDKAADIARESADIILLRKSLRVLKDGVLEGRKIFGNIIKYVRMGGSSNLGNMISMTGSSILLPFLPMAPIQILLNNFLYDVSQIAIPTDSIDEEYLAKPKKWDVEGIKGYMLYIGPISSLFDFITFGILLFIFNATAATQAMFHTGWFLESLCTQTLVIYVIRTEKLPFIESRPSRYLIATSLLVILAGFIIPLSPIGVFFEFGSVPLLYYPLLAFVVLIYLATVQVVKNYLYKTKRIN